MLGSALVRSLISRGFNNLVMRDRRELDLLEAQQVNTFFDREKPDYVFFAAAKVGGIQANIDSPFEFLFENLVIQNNVINAAQKNNVSKFCFVGSSCIYPRAASQPIKESYLMTGPLEPTNEGYALAKIAGIRLVQALHKQKGFSAICPLPCNLYGPKDSFHPRHSHVLSALVKKCVDAAEAGEDSIQIWGTGVARREFLHVDDAANGIIDLMEKYDEPGVINIGAGKDISILELAQKIAAFCGFRGKILTDPGKPDGMLKKCLDVTAITEFGFRPKIGLDDGIKEMIDIYKKEKLAL
jgi:GDP-L-fucose synthase